MATVKSQSQDEQNRSEGQASQGAEPSADVGTQIKQLLEKKIRNLEKRRAKLIQVKEEMEKGKDVHPEQKKAIERVTEVDYQLDFSRDLLKSVVSIVQDCNRQAKAQQRKEFRERIQAEQERMRDLLNMQELLNMLGSEDVQISSENLALLDYLYQKICPSHDDLVSGDNWNLILEEAGECASLLVSGSQRLVPTTKVSFKNARMVIEQIQSCDFYKRRTIIEPSLGDNVVSVDGDKKHSINDDLSNTFGGLSMTITNGNLSGDCCAKASPELLSHMHGHLSFLQEDQTMLPGNQTHFNNMNFMPVGMNSVYPMTMGTIYSQSAVPIQGNHVVYASGLGIDMSNPICPSAATENTFDGPLPAVVESRYCRQSQNVGYVDMRDFMQNPPEPQQQQQQQQQQQAFNKEPVNVAPPPSSTVEPRNLVEDFNEASEDDFSGFQDVRGSRSKMRRENKANNLTGHYGSGEGGGPRGVGRFNGRGRFGGRRAFVPRGRRGGGSSSSGDEYRQTGEVSFGRWEDQQESGGFGRGGMGGRGSAYGRGNFSRGGGGGGAGRGFDSFGGRPGFQRSTGFGQSE
uniref:Caprin-1_dimer domain-containing protein n=1 Tax=Trichuris muris TaxID=70415 RepID=A0A5S6Q5D4_TRIMR